MDGRYSDNIGELSPSLTLAIAARAKEMKMSGLDVIDLSAGQPDFPTPPFICEAGREAIDRGETRYTPAAGIPQLREAIAHELEVANGLSYSPEQVIVTAGAKQAIFNAIFCLFGREDEVLVPVPYWVSYPQMVAFSGAAIRYVETSRENDFRVRRSDLEGAVTDRTRGLILNSPNNPTGSVYSRDELHEIWSFCRRRSIRVISDEIYEKIIYDGRPFCSIAGVDREAVRDVVVVNGFSKAYSMTGWRIGYAAGPKGLIGVMGSLQSHTTSNASSISQWAALAALEQPGRSAAVRREMMEEFSRRRKYLMDRLRGTLDLSFIDPQGAFYLFIETSRFYGRRVGDREITGSIALCHFLLEDHGLAIVPGSAFGRDDYIRLSYAASLEDIERGIEKLERGLGTL
jgi:aspartate aminotransferase